MALDDVATFEYSLADYHQQTEAWTEKTSKMSKFDEELTQKWDDLMEKGVFRYKLDQLKTRIIPGSRKYVAQLNLMRAKERRKPQEIISVHQKFDHSQFNFNKIGSKEVIFKLEKSSQAVNGKVAEEEKNNHTHTECLNLAIVNVSPLEYGHILLVPDVRACQPQVLTESGVQLALECQLLSRHRGFKLGFNSLCALASVNHLHFHAYYLEHELVMEHCEVKQVHGKVYELVGTPAPGFAFQLHDSSVEEMSRLISTVGSYFQEAEIAHNLFITRGTVFGESGDAAKRTVRAYLWPREKFVGCKETLEFNVAVVELAGHLPIKDEDAYDTLTEKEVDAIIHDWGFKEEQFNKLKEKVVSLLASASKDAAASI